MAGEALTDRRCAVPAARPSGDQHTPAAAVGALDDEQGDAVRLLATQFGTPAVQLTNARTLSSVTVSLAYERSAIPHALAATGFVIASEDQTHGARACAFVSSKFAERAPHDKVLLRVFFRPSESDIRLTSDATYVERSSAWITRVLGAHAPPLLTWVSRWADALPIVDEAQQTQVRALESALAGSGIALTGSAFHGAGIDAAVRSAVGVEKRL